MTDQPKNPYSLNPTNIPIQHREFSEFATGGIIPKEATFPGQLPKSYKPTFWEDPKRIARYHFAAKAAPPGWQAPPWMDMGKIEQGYKYFQELNPDKPWYLWDYLDDDDPMRETLRGMELPDPRTVKDVELEYYLPEAGSQPKPETNFKMMDVLTRHPELLPPQFGGPGSGEYFGRTQPGQPEPYQPTENADQDQIFGVPRETWDQLPAWQKAIIPALPWVGRGVGALSGGIMGSSVGGPAGAVAGAAAGAGLAFGAEQSPTLSNLMMKLDVPAEYLERTIGTLSQILDSAFQPEKYGPLKEVLSNLPAAWQAAHLTQDVSFAQMTGPDVTAWELGNPEPQTWAPPDGLAASSYALTQARREIMAGAPPEQVWEKWGAQFGFAGTVRDMLGHMFLDPLNKLGEVTNFAGSKAAKAAGNAPLEQAFKDFNEPLYSLRAYGNELRQMPQAEAAQYGALSKWVAGLDKEGNLKDISTKPIRKGPAGVLDYMTGLTPAARATEVLHYSVDGLNVLVSELGGDDPAKMIRLVKAVSGVTPQDAVSILDGAPLPRWFQSAEAQAVPLAIRDQMPRLDAMLDQWQVTRGNATILQRVAGITGQDVNTFLADLHNAKPKEAADIYRQLVDSLKTRADSGDANAGKMLKTLTDDRSLSALDGQKLKQMADAFFGPDGAPFHPADFKARLMVALAEGMDGWAAKWFNVKPNKGIIRIANVVKKAQGLALLGLNPTYLINNSLNNIVTLAWDGLLGFSSHGGRMKFLQEMGIAPTRLRSGLGAAEMGEILDAGLAAEAQRLGVKDFQLGAQIREAGRAGDLIQAMDDFAKKGDKLAVFANLSQKVERWSSELAMVNAMREFWNRRWKAGDGFSRMDSETRLALDSVQDGLAEKIERAIARGKSKAEIENEIFSGLGRKSLRDVLTNNELDQLDHFVPDLSLSLEADLRKAKTDEDVRAAFRNARQEILSAINRDVIWKIQDFVEETAAKANIEKTQGVLDSLDQIMGSRHDFWLKHFETMDRVAEQAARATGGERRAIWDNALREADAAWNAFENLEGAKWLGLFKGLGAGEGSDEYIYTMARLTDMHDNWSQFYTARRQLMNNFFDQAESLDKAGRSQLWQETNQNLNREYVQALLEEDRLQQLLDIGFASQYARQMIGSQKAMGQASDWRYGIRLVRRKMAAGEVMYRAGSLPEEITRAWGADVLPPEIVTKIGSITSGIPPYLMPVKGRDAAAKEFYKVYTGFIREMLDAGNRNAPGGTPKAPSPDEPPMGGEPIPVVETPPAEPVVNAQPAVARLAPAPDFAQEVLGLARQYGVPTATNTGAPNDRYLLNIIRQAGYAVDDLSQVTPEMAENAFSIWAASHAKASPEQIALDREMLTARAQEIEKNIERLQLEAPRSFTREATTREIYDHFADQPEKAEAVITIMDQIADTWARENSATREDWYETFILERGGVEAGEGLRQLSPTERQTVDLSQVSDDVWKVTYTADEIGADGLPYGIFVVENNGEFSVVNLAGKTLRRFGTREEALSFGVNDLPVRGFNASDMPGFFPERTVERLFTNKDKAERFAQTLKGTGEYLYQLAPVNRSMTATELDDYARAIIRLGEDEVRRALRYEPSRQNKIALIDAVHRVEPKLAEKIAMEPGMLQQSAGLESPKGLTRWLDNGQAVIHAFESADVSTLVHEVAHVWLPMLGDDDLGLVERWLRDEYKLDLPDGWQHGTGHAEAKERFSRAFERYLAEGKAPPQKLQQVFEKFKAWMLDIYQAITGSDIDVKLNADIRAVFDKWMGEEAAFPPDRSGQTVLFGAGEDLPLFSGTPMHAHTETFNPPEASRQETLWDIRPQMKGSIPEVKTEPAPERLIQVHPEDVNYETAYRAYTGTSFSPERRASSIQQDYADHIRAVEDDLKLLADTPEKLALLSERLERYRQGYLSRLNHWLGSRHGLVSTMIAGPSNFPVARMNKRSDRAHALLGELLEWSQKEQRSIRNAIDPRPPRGISSSRADAAELIQQKITELESLQQRMVEGNKIVRKKDLSDEEKIAKLIELEWKEKTARSALEKDFAGRIGFPDYLLKNNNAEIRRLKGRVEEIGRLKGSTDIEWEVPDGRAEIKTEINRVQLFFDDKPDAVMREKLKQNGFKWAPSQGAWQRQWTDNARSTMDRLFSRKRVEEVIPEIKDTTPTIEPTIANLVETEDAYAPPESVWGQSHATPESETTELLNGMPILAKKTVPFGKDTYQVYVIRSKWPRSSADPDDLIYDVRKKWTGEYSQGWASVDDVNAIPLTVAQAGTALLREVRQRPSSLFQASPAMPPGSTFAFGTDPNRRYEFKYKLVELDDLITSHTDDLVENAAFPKELQPRDRERAASQMQINKIASTLEPESLLLDTHQLDRGPMIVGGDRIVESGNGRALALRAARRDHPERWTAYQDALRERLSEYGLSERDLEGMQNPVLIRERASDVDRPAFVREANESATLGMSAMENALSDAGRIREEALANLAVNDDWTIDQALRSAENRDFVRTFIASLPENERARLIDSKGELSAEGLTRLRQAILMHVFPGEAGIRLTRVMIESANPQVKNLQNVIYASLPKLARAEGLVRSGARAPEYSIADDLAKAVDMYARLKQGKKSVTDYLAQLPMIDPELNPVQQALLRYINESVRKPRSIREFLEAYADQVAKQADVRQMGMFEQFTPMRKAEMLDFVARSIDQEGKFAETAAVQAEAGIAALEQIDRETTPPVPEETPKPEPAPAVGAPLGTADSLQEPPLTDALLEGYLKEIDPVLAKAEAGLTGTGAMEPGGVYDLGQLDPGTMRGLKKYIGQVSSEMADVKLGSIRWGESRRDASLLNYSRRYGFDNVLGSAMPYEFWYTRSMLQWALRALSRPAILANYARIRNFAERQIERPGFPSRLKKKMGIPLPFLPDWMGEGIYADPLRQAYPFEQLARPFEQWGDQKTQEQRRAESVLDSMLTDEAITQEEYDQAQQTRSGPVWNRALAQARNEIEAEITNPLDFAFTMIGPSLPISIGYNLLMGRKDRISQLPVTRFIQATTGALGIGGPRGINIEGPLRRATGLPEVDRFEDYRVDRMLANLTAEGAITAEEAKRAMIERTGPAFELAQERVTQMRTWQYFGAPMGVDFFPEGEQEQRQLKLEYDQAIRAWKDGDDQALQKFFDQYPEYEARMASFQEPEERLKRFLISEVWDRYTEMTDLHKRQAREQLGDVFQDAFLNKETRSYDSIDVDTLAMWAQMLGGKNPQAAPDVPRLSLKLAPDDVANAVQAFNDERDQKFPGIFSIQEVLYSLPEDQQDEFRAAFPQLEQYSRWRNQYLATHPQVIEWTQSEESELYGLDVKLQQLVYKYRAEKDERWPNLNQLQEEYFAIPETDKQQRKAYRQAHPELTEYWEWRKLYAATYPKIAPYILSEDSLAEMILGEQQGGYGYSGGGGSSTPKQERDFLTQREINQFSPPLLRQLYGYFQGGQSLTEGATNELTRLWETFGKPGGDYRAWLDQYVEKSFR